MRAIRTISPLTAMPKRVPETTAASRKSNKRQSAGPRLTQRTLRVSSSAAEEQNLAGLPAAEAEAATEHGPRGASEAAGSAGGLQTGLQHARGHAERQRQQQAGAQRSNQQADSGGLHEVRVVSVRQALRGGGWTASFKQQYVDAGWQVFNLTSKSPDPQMVQLSPFYCHGGIPVPGLPGRRATSVERIWQGLKVFEQAPEDLSALDRLGMTGIKRTTRKNGKVLGHAWFGGGERQLLPYVTARRQIFLPAYEWVLENKVQQQMRRIAEALQQRGVVLLDYETNCDVSDARRPLSHASLVAEYVRKHWRALLQAGGS